MKNIMDMLGTVKERVLLLWQNITIEPVVAMYFLVGALSIIPGQELFLKKACNVNLNYSMDVCERIHEHEEEQIQTQKLVSGVQVTYHMIFITPLNIILFY